MIYAIPKNSFERNVNKLYSICSDTVKGLYSLDSDWNAAPLNLVYDEIFHYREDADAWEFLEEAVKNVGYPPQVLITMYESAVSSVEKLKDQGFLCPGFLGTKPRFVWWNSIEEEHRDHKRKQMNQLANNAIFHINRLARIIGKPELEKLPV